MKTNSEVEPALMKGKGNPVGGIEPETTDMFRSVWTPITKATPALSNAPKRSGALREIFINKDIKAT